MDKHLGHVGLSADHLERTAKAKPHVALSELIWNGLDADATQVDVRVLSNSLGIQEIVVSDNGSGFPFDDVEKCFGSLGASWKRYVRQTDGKRAIHGKEGRGRFRALALGRVCEWRVTFRSSFNTLSTFAIEVKADDPRDFRYSDPVIAEGPAQPGVEVRITEINDDAQFTIGQIKSELLQIFALYLSDYRPSVTLNGDALDPQSLIADDQVYRLAAISSGDTSYPVDLRIVEWKRENIRALFLCDQQGFPHLKTDTRFREAQTRFFSAYLRSTYVGNLVAQDLAALAEMDVASHSCEGTRGTAR